MNSNPAQAEAIRHGEGPMLVLAGPGSGKTYVITRRVRHLIEQLNVRPDQILVITYSKAAADEMRERFLNSPGEQYSGVTFGTFHAVFFHILQIAYNLNPSHILRDADASAVFRDIFADLAPELAEEPDMIRSIREEIERYKSNLPPGKKPGDPDVRQYEPLSCRKELFYPVMDRYLETMRARKLVDFDDMLSLTYNLFINHPDHLAFWRERFRYLLIDEFQDINPLQYEIVKLLAAPGNNLFAVGDDDQSVYGFRGSSPEIMLRFPKDYPGASLVHLAENYRCSSEILFAASSLIANNPDRYAKAHHSVRGPVAPVAFPVFENTEDECRTVAAQIREAITGGAKPDDFAILFRTNSEMRGIIRFLEKENVPFRCHSMPTSLFEHSAVIPVLSYLRLAAGGRDRRDWLMIVNKPVRYADRRAFPSAWVNLSETYTILKKKERTYVIERLQKLEKDLQRMSVMNPYAAIHYIRHVIGYNRHLTDTLSDVTEATDLLDEMMETAKDFRTIPEFLSYAKEDSAKRQKEHPLKDSAGVSLMTFHRAKGLEFYNVILLNCNELITPHKKALLPEQIAEERRLFYVAMTRAIGHLTLCSVRKRLSHDMLPSRFLGEIRLPESLLTPGSFVVHVRYGQGTVISLSGDRLKVRFAGHLLPVTLSVRLCREEGHLVSACYASGNSSSRSS